MENGRFTFFGEADGMKTRFVRCFMEDESGNVLIGSAEGLYYLSPENELSMISESRLDKSNIRNLYSDSEGNIYGLTANSEIFIVEDLKVTAWLDKGEITRNTITCIYPDPQNSGFLYLGLDTGELLYGNPLTHKRSLVHIPTQDFVNINNLLLCNSRLWIASDRGIGFIDENGSFVRPDKMQRNDSVLFIMSDQESNIWAASDRLGLIKMSPSIFANINSLASLPSMVVNTTFIKDDILYIGSDTGLICLDGEYRRIHTPVSELLKDARIRCITEDRSGCVWFCTWSMGLIGMTEE